MKLSALYVHVFFTIKREPLTERKAAFRLGAGNYGRKWGFCVHPSWHRESEKCVNTQAANPPVLTIQGNKKKKSKFLFTLIQSAVLTRSKICFSLFMIECGVIFSGRKIHSKMLKHCFIKINYWKRASLFWAGFCRLAYFR